MILRDLVTRIRFDVKTSPLESIQQALGSIQNRLTIIAGIGVIRGLAGLTASFGTFALDLQNSAEAAGLTTTEFQRLTFAATQAGVGQEGMARALQTLSKKLYDVRMGSEDAALAFAQARVPAENIATFKNSKDALYALADSLNTIPDKMTRIAVAQNIFGESGAKILKMIEHGSAGLRAAEGQGSALGAIVGTRDLNTLAEAEKTFAAFKQQVFVVAVTLFAKLAPAIRATVAGFAKFIAQGAGINRLDFKDFAHAIGFAMGYTRGIIEDLIDVMTAFAGYIPVLIRQIVKYVDETVGWQNIADGLTAVFQGIVSGVKDVSRFIKEMSAGGSEALASLREAFGTVYDKIYDLNDRWARYKKNFSDLDLRNLVDQFATFGAMFQNGPIGEAIHMITALASAISRLYEVLTGDKLSKTFLVDKLSGLGNIGSGLAKKLGLDSFSLPSADDLVGTGAAAKRALAANTDANAHLYAAPPSFANAMGNMAQFSGAQTGGPSASPNITAASGSNVTSNSVTLNAPITLSVPVGVDAQPFIAACEEKIVARLDTLLRQSQTAGVKGLLY